MKSLTNPYLRALTLNLSANDGKKTLGTTFGSNIHFGDGCEHLRDHISPSTLPVEEAVYIQSVNGTSSEIFGGFGVELKKLAHTPAQVCDLASHEERLIPNALILMEAQGKFFVALVFVRDGRSLCVRVF